MKLLLDFFPILLFFIAFKMYDIYVATAVAIAASVVQVSYLYIKNKRVEKMHLVTLALIVILGGATLLLHDETFIKWKPTIVNWGFALVFLGSHFIGKKPIVQRMMDQAVTMPEFAWRRLSFFWVAFFIFSGVANLYVAFNFDTDTWVNFKLFGLMGLTLAFLLLQVLYISRHMRKMPGEPEKDRQSEVIDASIETLADVELDSVVKRDSTATKTTPSQNK